MQTAATLSYSCRIISSFGASIRVTNVTSRRIVDVLVDSEPTRRVLFLSLARFFHLFFFFSINGKLFLLALGFFVIDIHNHNTCD